MKHRLHDCQMTSLTIGLLIRIAEIIGMIEGIKLQAPNPMLRKNNRIRTIQSSLFIEGNSLSR